MVGERHELNAVTRVRFVPTLFLVALALSACSPAGAAFYSKYDESEPLADPYARFQLANQANQAYQPYPIPAYDNYQDPTFDTVYNDLGYQNYDEKSSRYYDNGQFQPGAAGEHDLGPVQERQQLRAKIDAGLKQLFRVDAPTQPQFSDDLQYPTDGGVGLEEQRVPDAEDPEAARFPKLSLRQKQFAVHPGIGEYHHQHPNFLQFRLEELDQGLQLGQRDPAGFAANLEGSGDAEDPQQILLGAKRARIGTASHLRWEDFAVENRENDFFFTVIVAASTAFAIFGVVGAGYCYHRRIRSWKESEEVEYPSYGVTGPAKDVSPGSDRKLAQSAQIYHYQHQKNQMLGACLGEEESEGDDTEGEEQEGDYTVYECPGLASTDEMEVKNPLFDYAEPAQKP